MQGKEIETDVYFYYAMWSYGGEIVEEDGKSGLDSQAAIDAAKLYKSLIDEGLTRAGRHRATTARTCRTSSSRARSA